MRKNENKFFLYFTFTPTPIIKQSIDRRNHHHHHHPLHQQGQYSNRVRHNGPDKAGLSALADKASQDFKFLL
jgi:hypothetical protein